MAADDPVDTTALIFTEADVFAITGSLAERWGFDGDAVAATEEAITAALNRDGAA